MSRKPSPCELAAQAQIRAALALRRSQLALATYAPPGPTRAELLNALAWLIESVTPSCGSPPILRFTKATPTTGAAGRHNRRPKE